MIGSFAVAKVYGEIKVQSPGYRNRVAVFQSRRIVHLVPKSAAWLASEVAGASDLEVVGEYLAVDTDVVACQWFPLRGLAEPLAQGQVSTVGAPVPMNLV